MSKRFVQFAAALTLAVSSAAACGDDEEGAAPTPGDTTPETTPDTTSESTSGTGAGTAPGTDSGDEPGATGTPVTGDEACVVIQGNIADRGFNQSAWEGAQSGAEAVGLGSQYVATSQESEHLPAIRAYLDQPCAVIVTVSFALTDATATAAADNPDQRFAIVDVSYTPEVPNVRGLVFDSAQSSFLAGYLAAGMSETGVVGVYGGEKIPPVTIFMDGYAQGVDYHNETKGTDVQLLGWNFESQDGTFVGNFVDAAAGKQIAETMMQQGADVIFGLGGGPDFGAAEAIKSEGNGEVMMIWPNHDGCVAAPDLCDIILTTVEKDVETVVDQAVRDVGEGTFEGGTYLGTLENGGVGISPFHEFEGDVPQELKDELEAITDDITAGEIVVESPSLPE